MSLRIAGLPFAKTIEEYDFAFHESLDKRQVMSLFDLDFIGRKENIIFLGPPGVGKTPACRQAGIWPRPWRLRPAIAASASASQPWPI